MVADPKYVVDETHWDIREEDKVKLRALLEEFKDIFSICRYDLGLAKITPISIETTTNQPIVSKILRTPIKYREVLNKEIEEMVKSGVMEESDTPWVSSFLVVPKKDGTIRPCIDFRALNAVTIPDRYPIPKIDDIINDVAGCVYYSTVDVSKGYWQMPLNKLAQYLCGVRTEDKVYKMLSMPFGLRNATAAFARAMKEILGPVAKKKGVKTYIDDLLACTREEDFNKHLELLRTIFERLRMYNMKLQPQKCEFARKTISFLGHEISKAGYTPAERNLQSIRDLPVPKTPKQVLRVMGACGYFRKYIRDFAKIADPMYKLVKKEKSGNGDQSSRRHLRR